MTKVQRGWPRAPRSCSNSAQSQTPLNRVITKNVCTALGLGHHTRGKTANTGYARASRRRDTVRSAVSVRRGGRRRRAAAGASRPCCVHRGLCGVAKGYERDSVADPWPCAVGPDPCGGVGLVG